MTALIYDKTSSMTQLSSDANVFRRAVVPQDDIRIIIIIIINLLTK